MFEGKTFQIGNSSITQPIENKNTFQGKTFNVSKIPIVQTTKIPVIEKSKVSLSSAVEEIVKPTIPSFFAGLTNYQPAKAKEEMVSSLKQTGQFAIGIGKLAINFFTGLGKTLLDVNKTFDPTRTLALTLQDYKTAPSKITEPLKKRVITRFDETMENAPLISEIASAINPEKYQPITVEEAKKTANKWKYVIGGLGVFVDQAIAASFLKLATLQLTAPKVTKVPLKKVEPAYGYEVTKEGIVKPAKFPGAVAYEYVKEIEPSKTGVPSTLLKQEPISRWYQLEVKGKSSNTYIQETFDGTKLTYRAYNIQGNAFIDSLKKLFNIKVSPTEIVSRPITSENITSVVTETTKVPVEVPMISPVKPPIVSVPPTAVTPIPISTITPEAVKAPVEVVKPEVSKTPEEQELDKIYQENKIKEDNLQKPSIGLSIREVAISPKITTPIQITSFNQIKQGFSNLIDNFKKIVSPLYFYKDAPMKLRNDIRTDIIGGLNKVIEQRNKNFVTLFGGMENPAIEQTIELIKLRDQMARIAASKGNPLITIEEANTALKTAETNATPDIIKAAERYRKLQNYYQNKLVEMGKLEPTDLLEDYVRHYVSDYTPDWIFNKGIPARLRMPFRGYLKKAGQTSKEYVVDRDTILGQFLEMDYDNLIEDFMVSKAIEYDITPKLSPAEKQILFRGSQPKPNRIYEINNKMYRAFNPSSPFSRVVYPTEEGVMAIGKYRKTYLVPEKVYNTFKNFSEKGNHLIASVNRVVSLWKTMAIFSKYPSYNINNIVGDTYMAFLQMPEPLKFTSKIPEAVHYLAKGTTTPYLQRLDKFIKDNDILGATIVQSELYNIRGGKNPVKYLFDKAGDLIQFRESILRTSIADYLYSVLEKGDANKIKQLRNYFSYTGIVDEMTDSQAFGKVARDVEIDYKWTSKPYNRFIRGALFPLGTWYFKASSSTWKFATKHLGKALMVVLGLPILAALFNDRDKKTRELEGQLPSYYQDSIHLNFGENPDGTVRVMQFQLPQDVLIGTKIFSIAVNQTNLVAIGKKSVKDAAIDTLKRWGIKEEKGMLYLANFMVRFIKGLVDRKDPYDNAPVYSNEPEKLTTNRKVWEQSLFLFKVMTPFLQIVTRNYQQGKPLDVTKQDIIDSWAGKGILGINDTNKQDEIYFEGKPVKWDDINVLKEISAKENNILDSVENAWVASGLTPDEFLNRPEFKSQIERMKNMYIGYVPQAEQLSLDEIVGNLGERIANRIGDDATSAAHWYRVQSERAKTDEEKKELAEVYSEIRQQNILDAIDAYPKTSKDIFMQYILNK